MAKFIKIKFKGWLTGLVFLALFVFISSVAVLPGVTNAQTNSPPPPVGTECKLDVECNVGPYSVKISFDRATLNTTDDFLITVQRLDNPTKNDWNLQAEIVPYGRTSAVEVKYDADRFLPSNDPTIRQIKGYYPISGTWWLHIGINGAAGLGQFRIATTVEAPPKMPDWLAWAIGLSPIIGIVGFALGQWRLVIRRKREERLAAAALAPTTLQPVESTPSQVN